jgi:hypothetical protein
MKSVPVVVAVFLSTALFAQTATLRGVVTDESGAIVQGATITLTNSAGRSTIAVSRSDGSYSMGALAAGDYTAQAAAPDLKTGPIKVAIRAGDQTLNLSLKIVLVSQEVTVHFPTR